MQKRNELDLIDIVIKLKPTLGGESKYRAVDLESSLVKNVGEHLLKGLEFYRDPQNDAHEFDPSYKPASDEYFKISNFNSSEVFDIFENTAALERLEENELKETGLSGILLRVDGGETIIAQVLDSRYMLQRPNRISLLFSNRTLKPFTKEGLALGNKIDLIVQDGILYFKSYFNARRILDLTRYYREATDDDLQAFYGHEYFEVDDIDEIFKASTSDIRKTVSQIIDSRVLDNHSVEELLEGANQLDVKLDISNDKIKLPSEKKELKVVLGLFNNQVYKEIFGEKTRISNSSKEL